jgi:hypothetical protein
VPLFAGELKNLVCFGDESAPYILRGLTSALPGYEKLSRVAAPGPFAQGLIKSILAPDCPVSAALTDADKAALKKLAKEVQPSESKQ